MKQMIRLLFVLSMVISMLGCANQSEGSEVKTSPDDVFIEEFGKAINKRWAEQDKLDESITEEEYFEKEKEYLEKNAEILEKELETIEKSLANVEDRDLKETGNQYVEGAKLQIEMFKTEDYDLQTQYSEESAKLRKPALIKLVDEYGVKINEENQQRYKDFKAEVTVINAENAANEYADKLAQEIVFERTVDEYGDIVYSAIIENKSDIEYDSLQYDVQYKDKDGIVIGDDYIVLDNFTPGTKQKVELTMVPDETKTLEILFDQFYLK